MSAVDFEAWALDGLDITLGGRTFVVPPPSVDAARKIIAAAVRGEVNLTGEGEVPEAVQRVLDSIEPDEHPALGPAHQEMVDAGINPVTIDRVAYYAVFYWARGKAYADALGMLLWAPREAEGRPATDASPKG